MMNYMEIPRSEKAMDECGVFGFYNNNDIDSIALTHDALYGLQHRGQVSAGITVNNGGKFSTIKELGMVSEVFPQRVLATPRASLWHGLNHSRYFILQATTR